MKRLNEADPRSIGPYRLLRRLGSGGMGQVFLGLSPGGRLVAVKVVAPGLAEDEDFRRRFALEAAAAREVGGFYTAQVVDADPDADRPWLVTAYIPGPSLSQAVRAHGPLPHRALRVLGSGLAEGLAAIHGCGLVHRDLKPGNVILADDGPRIIDFGIVRSLDAHQATTAVIGTPGYMSPEQARGRPTGPESDIFALACVLAFAATGRSPYGTGGAAAVVYRTVHERPDLTGVPPELAPFLSACLAREPEARPGVAEALEHLSVSAEDGGDAGDDGHPQWLPADVSAMIGEHKAQTQALPADTGDGPGGPSGRGLGNARRRRTAALAGAGALALAAGAAIAWSAASVLESPESTAAPSPEASSASAAAPAPGIGAGADPCDVIDNDLIGSYQLVDTGTPGGHTEETTSVKTCEWGSAAYTDGGFSLTLAYGSSPFRMFPERADPEDAVDLSGLPDGTVHVESASEFTPGDCEVGWSLQDGHAAVLASFEADGVLGGAPCDVAADFARDVSAKVAD